MRFRSFDNLRLFTVVARHLSFTAAGAELHLSKGAVSYQITRLENELGFTLFERQTRGVTLTEAGNQLLYVSRVAFDDIESEIDSLRRVDTTRITVGMTTYFASRWLSPRLMHFTSRYPKIGLRLQPTVGIVDPQKERIDMLIRWGKGDWQDLDIEPLLPCPVTPTAGADIAQRVKVVGLETVLSEATLLQDVDDSVAWRDWHRVAGIRYRRKRDELVIPDPNVRVQGVIDGQGIALNDRLVDVEIASGKLFRISDVEADDYGYFLAYPKRALENPALKAFRDWIVEEVNQP